MVFVKSVEPEEDPEVAALLREGRGALTHPPPHAQLRGELLIGLALLLAATALALGGADAVDVRAGLLIVLVLAYAAATTVTFELGQGETDSTLLVLVPMLFLLPTPLVPLLVILGYALGRIPDIVRNGEHPLHLVFSLANAWHAFGAAFVLVLATDPGGPRWADAPWYLVALLALLLTDTAAGVLRERVARGVRPDLQLRLLLRVWLLDGALAPVGLAAAFAATRGPYGFLLLAPLAPVLGMLARERNARLGHALDLLETRTALLETELAAARGREEALAAVSHGLQTPLASVVGLARLLDERGAGLADDRRATATNQLHREALALRHRVRQILDYPHVRSGQPLALRPTRCDLAVVVTRAVAASGLTDVQVSGTTPEVLTDAVRAEQVLTVLLDNAGRHGRPPVTIALATGPTGAASIAVTDQGGGVPEPDRDRIFAEPEVERGRHEAAGTGIGLYVAAGIVAQLGGTLDAGHPDGGGACFTLTLPTAPAAVEKEAGVSPDPPSAAA